MAASASTFLLVIVCFVLLVQAVIFPTGVVGVGATDGDPNQSQWYFVMNSTGSSTFCNARHVDYSAFGYNQYRISDSHPFGSFMLNGSVALAYVVSSQYADYEPNDIGFTYEQCGGFAFGACQNLITSSCSIGSNKLPTPFQSGLFYPYNKTLSIFPVDQETVRIFINTNNYNEPLYYGVFFIDVTLSNCAIIRSTQIQRGDLGHIRHDMNPIVFDPQSQLTAVINNGSVYFYNFNGSYLGNVPMQLTWGVPLTVTYDSIKNVFWVVTNTSLIALKSSDGSVIPPPIALKSPISLDSVYTPVFDVTHESIYLISETAATVISTLNGAVSSYPFAPPKFTVTYNPY